MRLATHRCALFVLCAASTLAGCSGAADGPNTTDVSAAADAGVAVLDDVGDLPHGDPNTGVVYIAARGVSTPWLVPVADPTQARQLGPRRGAGYGLGEGEVSYPDVTPDGKTVVVIFYTMDTPASKSSKSVPILFALPIDGSGATKPIRVATAKAIRPLDRAYTATRMAYVDGSSLYVARLDGGDSAKPLLVAAHAPSEEVSAPRWLPDGKRLVYAVRPKPGVGSPVLFTVSADGAQAQQPQPVLVGPTTGVGGGKAEWVAAIMPDGRLIVRGPDDRLYRVGGATPPVALTPAQTYVTPVGLSAAGDRIALVLRQNSQGPRRVVTVATDGSDADAPHELTVKPAAKLTALRARDGHGLAWVADDGAGEWAVWRAGFGAGESAKRISTSSSKQLYITAYDHGAGVLLGSRTDGSVLRFRLDSPQPEPPQVLATVEDIVNNSHPWPVLSADATHVLYDANTTSGWHGWTRSLTDGETHQHEGAWYRNLVTKWGFVTHEYVHEEAAFVVDLAPASAGSPAEIKTLAPAQLTAWRNSPMTAATLLSQGTHLIFAREEPVPGWYAAPTQASTAAAPGSATLVMPRPVALPKHQMNAWQRPPAVVANHLVRAVDDQLVAFALNGVHALQPRKLGVSGVLAWAHTATSDDQLGVVLLAPKSVATSGALAGAQVVAATLADGFEAQKGSAGTSVPLQPVMTLPATTPPAKVVRLVVLPAQTSGSGSSARRVLAVVRQGSDTSLYVASVDGSQHKAPVLLASGLPGWLLNLVPTPDGAYALAVLSVEATAVPHPDLLLAVPTLSAPQVPSTSAYALAPKHLLLWGCNEPGCDQASQAGAPPRSALTSADGSQLVLRGAAGLYSARLTGADVQTPTHLGALAEAGQGHPLRSGDRLLLIDGQAAHITTIGVAGSQRQLTLDDGAGVAAARWVEAGKRVIFLRGSSASWAKAGRLFVIDAAAKSGAGTPLVGPAFGVSKLVAAVPDRPSFLVESEVGGDHSLYAVPLDGSAKAGAPKALTPVDDATERFLGFR